MSVEVCVDVRVHSASAAVHWNLGGASAAAVHISQVGRSLSALGSESAHVSAER